MTGTATLAGAFEMITTHISFMRREVTVDALLDRQEHQRREERGWAGRRLGDLSQMCHLASLPYARPVREPAWLGDSSFTPEQLAVCFDRHQPDLVTRVALVPADPVRIGLRAKTWRQAVHPATVLSQYGPCSVILPSAQGDDLAWTCSQACYWGLGLIVEPARGEPLRLVEPAIFSPDRFTGALWLFAEDIYVAASVAINQPV